MHTSEKLQTYLLLKIIMTKGAASSDPPSDQPPIFHAFSRSRVRAYTRIIRKMM